MLAVTGGAEQELLRLMDYFGTAGMQWEVQMGILSMRGVKAVVRLALIGGGHHMLRRASGMSPFGNARSKGGPRRKDPVLAAAGSRMLVAVAWRSPWIKCRMVKVRLAALREATPGRAGTGSQQGRPLLAGPTRGSRQEAGGGLRGVEASVRGTGIRQDAGLEAPARAAAGGQGAAREAGHALQGAEQRCRGPRPKPPGGPRHPGGRLPPRNIRKCT